MSTFVSQKNVNGTAPPDPTRHVFFHQGMVLGEDDFRQEFAYLAGRDQWLARDLLGYGTVTGLRMRRELDDEGKPRIAVEPGVAVSPRGQLIRVPTAQCAYLNDWFLLDQTKERIGKDFSLLSVLPVYVILCYRACPTEKVPLPGEPCRSEDDLLVDSRLADDFELRLSFDPPGQREEDALRDVVEWVSQIEISETETSTPLKDFLDELRLAAHTLSSPPLAGAGPLPDYLFGSPPASLVINAEDVCEYLRAAFRLWVTELRPLYRPEWFSGGHGCSGQATKGEIPPEDCLLLAEVRVPVDVLSGVGARRVSDPNQIEIHEERRPYLVHLRMLQEWLLCGKHAGFATTPPVLPQPGGVPPAEQTFGLTPKAGESLQYSRADHSHGTPPDPIPAHVDLVNAHLFHEIHGDVTEDLSKTRVSFLQGHQLRLPAPTPSPALPLIPDGHVLTYDSSARAWRNEAPQPGTVTDVVRHPVGLPEFRIEAAGQIACKSTSGPDGFTYNGLFVRDVQKNIVELEFNDYNSRFEQQERGLIRLIVKALAVFMPEELQTNIPDYNVFFGTFEPKFFTLVLMRGRTPLHEVVEISRVNIHVEVSSYEVVR